MGNQRIGKDAATLTAAKTITLLIGLASSMLLSRFRTLEEYGTYSQILLVIGLANAFFMLGLPNSTNYFLGRSDSREEKRHFLSVYYTLNTCLCIIIGIVLTAAVPLFVAYFDNEYIRDFTYIFAVLPSTKVIISSISNVLVVYGKTKKLTLFNVLNASVVVIAILIVQVFNWSFQVYMLLYLLGESIMMLWAYFIVSKLEKGITPALDYKLIKSIFMFSVPIGLASLVGTLTLECDKLVIGKLFDTETLAIYTNSAKELPFTIIATSLTAVLLPQMARKLKENKVKEAVELWKTTAELSYIVMSFIVTALIVYSPQIITILYSDKYLPGVSVFRIYSAILLLRITYWGMLLNASGKTKFIMYSSIITLFVNVLLDIALFYIFGIIGPAIATFISIITANVAQLMATSKLIKNSFSCIFPWKQMFFHILINLAWGLPVFFIMKVANVGVSNNEIIYCVISGILVMVLYFLVEKKRIHSLWNRLNSGNAKEAGS
ncbi:MAG: oligosaccharide flippase family protein [Clostridiales bacterium]|nr:oligosaccharide flippase family protein [Clostridiales bacterium]